MKNQNRSLRLIAILVFLCVVILVLTWITTASVRLVLADAEFRSFIQNSSTLYNGGQIDTLQVKGFFQEANLRWKKSLVPFLKKPWCSDIHLHYIDKTGLESNVIKSGPGEWSVVIK